jgi:hypothetical protein
MGRVVVIQHLTLDGVMQAPGHPEEDPRHGFEHGGWAPWSLLLGPTTYERFADF